MKKKTFIYILFFGIITVDLQIPEIVPVIIPVER